MKKNKKALKARNAPKKPFVLSLLIDRKIIFRQEIAR